MQERGMTWFRLYHGLANSVRIGKLSDRAFRLYILLQCAASEKRAGGRTGLSMGDASWRFRFEVDEPFLELAGKDPPLAMIDGDELVIPDWSVRQPPSDNSATRTKAYRQRIALIGGDLHPDVVAEVRERDKRACVYCGSQSNLVTDHAVPIILGGDNGVDNLMTACKRCNSGKAGRTPEQAGYAFHNLAAEQVYLSAYKRIFTKAGDGHGLIRDGHGDTERREEERRGEGIAPPVASARRTASAEPRGSRLPEVWKLPKRWGEWALKRRPQWTPEDVRRVAEQFHNHWIAKAGKEARKVKWEPTWHNWIDKEPATFAPKGAANGTAKAAVGAALFGERDNERPSDATVDISGESRRIA